MNAAMDATRQRLTTTRWGLDTAELVTSGVAAVISSGLFIAYRAPYLARGVVGDLLGFAVLAVPLALRRQRARHEALVCLAGIGLVHVSGADWPLPLGSGAWWALFTVGLGGYVALRRRQLPDTP